MKNIFEQEVKDGLINRINQLTPESIPLWGKMNVSQMLAHSCVSFEMAYNKNYPKPHPVLKFFLKFFVKQAVVGPKQYKKGTQTAPQFLIREQKDFEKEKKRLLDYINKTFELGEDYFDGREYISFGKLTKEEWNNLFYKHLDHHLNQFGV